MLSSVYLILKSYLSDRYFQIKQNNATTDFRLIQAGVPQGSVLGPNLYLIYTVDIPIANYTTIATFDYDTAILAKHENPQTASANLQYHIDQLQDWLAKQKIKVKSDKSTQITFATKHRICIPVTLKMSIYLQKNEVKYL